MRAVKKFIIALISKQKIKNFPYLKKRNKMSTTPPPPPKKWNLIYNMPFKNTQESR